jgi:hypothetical protein
MKLTQWISSVIDETPDGFCCNRCKEYKTRQDFSPRKDRPNGLHYSCKTCLATQAKDRRAKGLNTPNREVAKMRSKLWRKQNPSQRNALKAAYKASKVKATPSWLNLDQKEQIVNFYELAKDCCLTTGLLYEVDHIVPLRGKNVCGLHVPWNLQILPVDINRRKSNSHEH